jgi:hypothetical protein
MQVDIFKDILVSVIGGLGIFMLGLEYMSNGPEVPTFDRATTGAARRMASRPEPSMLVAMTVTALVLCVSAPNSTPRSTGASGRAVSRLMAFRARRPASCWRLLLTALMPMKKSPSPPRMDVSMSMLPVELRLSRKEAAR